MKRKSIFALLTSLTALSALLFALTPASQAVPGEDGAACLFNGRTVDLQDIDHPDQDANADGNTDRGFTASGASPTPLPLDEIGDTIGPSELAPVGNLLDVEDGSNTSAADGSDADPGANTWPPGQTGDQDYRFDTNPSPFQPILGANDKFTTSCVHIDTNGAGGILETDNTSVYTSSIIASGSYENLICGTGSTNGRAVLSTVDNVATGAVNDPDGEAAAVKARYWIMFQLGQGLGVFEGEIDPSGRDIVGTTVVDIRPTPSATTPPGGPEGCVTTPVVDFDVTGIVAGATDDGTASDNAVVEGITDGV